MDCQLNFLRMVLAQLQNLLTHIIMHLGETQSILFESKKRLRTSNKLHVVCNGSEFERDDEVTCLGVNLDQSLTGSSIVNKTGHYQM